MKTELDPAWLDGLALAALVYQDRRMPDRVETLLQHLCLAAGQFDAPPIVAYADLAEAVARAVRDSNAQGFTVPEFRLLGSEERVDPGMFEHTIDGRAGVWSARVLSAAASSDMDQADALIASRTALGVDEVRLGLLTLIRGAAMIWAAAMSNQDWDALVAMGRGAPPIHYTAHCYAGNWAGLDAPPDMLSTLRPCFATDESDRGERDRAAAEHILSTKHTVTWGMA